MCMEWYHIVVLILICISLRINDVEHLFKCVLAICLIFFGEVSKFSTHYFIRLFAFLFLNCRISRYILDINPLLDIWFTNIFSQSVGYLFTLWVVSFDAQKC